MPKGWDKKVKGKKPGYDSLFLLISIFPLGFSVPGSLQYTLNSTRANVYMYLITVFYMYRKQQKAAPKWWMEQSFSLKVTVWYRLKHWINIKITDGIAQESELLPAMDYIKLQLYVMIFW